MKIQLLYFASLAQALDLSEETLQLDRSSLTVAELKSLLSERSELWQNALFKPSIRCAVAQKLADENCEIRDGEEVAFFPPVTGG